MFNGIDGICFNKGDYRKRKVATPLFEKLSGAPSARETPMTDFEYCGWSPEKKPQPKEIDQSSAMLVHIVKGVNNMATYCGLTQWVCGQHVYHGELERTINAVAACVGSCDKCISMALSELSSLQTGIDKYALPEGADKPFELEPREEDGWISKPYDGCSKRWSRGKFDVGGHPEHRDGYQDGWWCCEGNKYKYVSDRQPFYVCATWFPKWLDLKKRIAELGL